MLSHHHLSRFHETVATREHRDDIGRKLDGSQDDGHTAEVGEHEARQLSCIDMSAEKPVEYSVH
jgi:hypothetical protein